MKNKQRTLLAVWIAASISLPVLAVEPAGMVKTSKGPVSIERDGKKLIAVVGTPVLPDDRLRTGQNAAVGISLRDNTLLSAGPNTLIVIDKYVFDSSTLVGDMLISIRKGTLSVVTGKLAKQKPESVEFHTPTSVLGVRGTEFVIAVEGGSDE